MVQAFADGGHLLWGEPAATAVEFLVRFDGPEHDQLPNLYIEASAPGGARAMPR
jgi:hypothetical protein